MANSRERTSGCLTFILFTSMLSSCHSSGFLVQVNASRAGNAAQCLQQKRLQSHSKLSN